MNDVPRTIAVAALVVSLAIVPGTAAKLSSHTKLKGQIIAYRPFERVVQMPSSVVNKESFLVRVGNSRADSRTVTIKLVYEHFGYSELGEDVLSQTPLLKLKVHRNKSCDETYRAFVQNSGTFKFDDGEEIPKEKVVFISPFENTKLSPEQPLRCYTLQSWGFEARSTNPSQKR